MRRGVAIGLGAILLAGCGGSNGPPQDATLHVTPPSALLDVPAKIDVAGLKGGDRVVVTGTATDVRGTTWTSTESTRADGRGDARLDGGMLLALMHARGARAISYLNRDGVTRVRLSATVGGQRVAGGAIARTIVAPGVRVRRLTVAHDGLAGDFFTSPGARGAPIVAIGGSNGLAPTLPAAHPDLRYPAAGHGVGLAVPYLPSPDPAQAGGSAAADAAARAALWPRLLEFLDEL